MYMEASQQSSWPTRTHWTSITPLTQQHTVGISNHAGLHALIAFPDRCWSSSVCPQRLSWRRWKWWADVCACSRRENKPAHANRVPISAECAGVQHPHRRALKLAIINREVGAKFIQTARHIYRSMTLKSGSEVTQGDCKWYNEFDRLGTVCRFSILLVFYRNFFPNTQCLRWLQKCWELENRVRRHSRSSKIIPFDPAPVTSY